MTTKKKLLIVVPYFPPHAGGTERFVLNMAKQLTQHYGWDITIVTTKKGKKHETSTTDGLKIHYLPYTYKLSNSPISLRWFGMLRSIVREIQPDLINIQTPVPGLGDITALIAGKRPVVVNYHMGTMMKRRSPLNFIIWTYEHAFVVIMLKKAKRILSASEFVRNKFLASYRYKTTTVTPAVDTELFHPADTLATAPHILFNGSLNKSDKHKGLYILLEACHLLLPDIPGLKLTIVSDGNGQQKYEKRAEDLGLKNVVRFAGRISHHQLAQELREASVFALPSSNDNVPLAIMEAMASGLPVVSTTVGGIHYIVDNGKSGLLITPNNIAALTEALKQVLLDRQFAAKLGEEGRKKALNDLRWTRQASLTDQLFREAIGQLSTDQRVKVAEILLHYDPNKGGLQEYVHEIADGLLKDKIFEVFIVTPVIGLRRKKVKVIDGVTLYRLPVLVWYMWLPFNPFTRRLKRIFEREEPSVVQIHMPISRLSGAALKASNGVPTVLTYHTANMTRSKFLKASAVRLYQNLFLEHMLEHVTSILVVSPAILRTKWREYRYKTNIVLPRVVASLFAYGQRSSRARGGSQASSLVLVGDGDDVERNVVRSGTAKAFRQHVITAHVSAFKAYVKTVATHPVSIVQIISYYPPHIGGAEKVAEAVSLELANRGYVVQVVTSDIGNRSKQKELQDSRFRVQRLKSFEFAHTPIMPGYIWSLMRIKKPTIFHLHLTHAYSPELMWFIAKLRRIPYIVHFHLDADPSGTFGMIFKLYKRFIHPIVFHGAAHVITLSPEQADMIRQRFDLPEDRVSYLPNGVSQKFLDIGKKPRTPHKTLRLLYVGRISPQKRIDRLVEALALVRNHVQVTIVGDGYLREKLENRSKELGLTNVEWLGFKEGDELMQLYADHDAFVLPSDKEGMPLVMFEAMAVGMPVIGSNVQGIREHLKGVGIVVTNPSPESFALAIDDFCDHVDELYDKLSRNSRDKAAQYSWVNLTERLETVYRQLTPVIPQRRAKRPRLRLLLGVALWWLAFIALRQPAAHVPPYIVNSVGFSFLALVPGLLTMMCFRLEALAPWAKLTLAIGLSLMELMAVTVIGNSVLQLFGVARPLDATYLIGEISLLLIVLGVFVWRGTQNWQGLKFKASLHAQFPSWRDWVAGFTPALFVVMSVFGVNTLNNGGNDDFVLSMLCLMGLYSLFLFWKSQRLSDTTIAVALYFMAVSLLLSTSLRGWLTTGHDIQVEYQVFQLAKTNGVWQIQIFRNAYNACLSITILPTVFANLLKVFDPYVFKIYYQIMFATVPPLLYLFARKWSGKGLAFLAAFYFIAFPTYFTDMPFLNRQEIAFIIFALMLYLLFQDHVKLSLRRGLFLVLSLGLIFAHYSTTYSVIIIVGIAVVSWPVIERLIVWYKKHRGIAASAHRGVKRLTISMLIIIASMSFIWSSVLTETSNNSVLVIHETYLALTDRLQGGAQKSNDTNYSLLSWKNASPNQQLQEYVHNIVDVVRAKSPQSYYPASDYQHMNINATTDDVQRLTWFGTFLKRLGINVVSANFLIRQGSAKLLQLLVVAGIIYIIMRKKYASWLDGDYIALTLGCIVFMGLQVVLPVLSVEYGLLRAFQQSLMLLGLFTVLGSVAFCVWLPNKFLKFAGPAILAVLFFFSSTGVFTQLTGGYYAQLNLNNSGSYYDLYYTHPQEVAAISWLNNDLLTSSGGLSAHPEVQTDAFTVNRLLTYTQLPIINDLYPGLIKRDAYVYLGYADLTTKQASVAYSGNTISYTYPMKFLNQQKDLIYDNGGAEIYK